MRVDVYRKYHPELRGMEIWFDLAEVQVNEVILYWH